MLRRYPKLSRIYSVASDLVLVLLAYVVAIYLRNLILHRSYDPVEYLQFPELLLSIIIIWWSIIIFFKLNESTLHSSLRQYVKAGWWCTVIGLSLLLSTSFLARIYFPRSIIIIFACTYLTFYILVKSVIKQLRTKLNKVQKTPILIVGAGERAKDFCDDIDRGRIEGYHVVGFLDLNEDRIGEKISGNHPIIGSFSQVGDILSTYVVSEVMIVLPPRQMAYLEQILAVSHEAGVTARVIFNPEKFKTGFVSAGSIEAYPTINYSRLPANELGLFVKRVMDVAVSGVALVLLSPLLLAIAILVKNTSKGPIFYKWKVVGRNNRDFVGYKFRTMVENADELKATLMAQNEMSGPAFKMKNDPRITPAGKWLRKFSLDELPQLWSVLKGDMSLVGPRPPSRKELARFEFWQRRKISFKPGITCLWQVKGRNGISDFNDWCKLDLYYIDNWSLFLDIKILLQTAAAVFRGTGC